MIAKNFVIIITDSNGDRDAMPVTITGKDFDSHDVKQITSDLIREFENLDPEDPNAAYREDYIEAGLLKLGYAVKFAFTQFEVFEAN